MLSFIKKYSFTIFFIFVIAISLMYGIACQDSATEAENEFVIPDSVLEDSLVNYNEHIQKIFIIECGSRNGCHSSFEPAYGLDLTMYQNIISHQVEGYGPLIILGDGINSFLYNILLDTQFGRRRMPPDEAALSANNIIGIRLWIDLGAPLF